MKEEFEKADQSIDALRIVKSDSQIFESLDHTFGRRHR
jgi:hypothetical protein